MHPDPFDQFEDWYAQARQSAHGFSEAMTLATATPAGVPSARMVLLRGWDRRGFRFFTNYQSKKGNDLASNPNAALVFYWHEPGCQVRISGTAERLSAADSDEYFQKRPRGSQIGAWISQQSQPIPTGLDLQERFAAFEAAMEGKEIPRPANWGGYLLKPREFEFWANRPYRLHDRFRYTRQEKGGWTSERLFP
jgi:pyridoxamine 5'-phosphate oxidase